MAKRLPQPSIESFDLTTVLAALADPVRRHLMRILFNSNEAVECAFFNQNIDLTGATISHHWRVLREAGLTTTTVHGRSRIIEARREEIEDQFPGLLRAILTPQEPQDQLLIERDKDVRAQ